MNAKKKNNGEEKISIIETLKNENRFRILVLLHLYPELSFSEIAKKLNKNKSTIHPHLDKLIKAEVIEVSREEKVRGNIPSKFYSLRPGYIKKLSETDSEMQKVDQTALKFYRTYLNFAIKTLELYNKFFEGFLRGVHLEKLHEIMKEEKGFSSMLFLSEDQFKKALKYYKEFVKELNKIEAEENGIKREKPYYIFTFGMALKDVMDSMEVN